MIDLIASAGPARVTPRLKLRYLMSRSGGVAMTVKDIAELIGIQPRTVRGWLTGTRPTPASLARLQDAYGAVWAQRNPRLAHAHLLIEGTPLGAIQVQGRDREYYLIEDAPDRPWGAMLAARRPTDVFDPDATGETTGPLESFISAAYGPPVSEDYLWFYEPAGAQFVITAL